MYKEIFRIPHLQLVFQMIQPVLIGITFIQCIDEELQFSHWALQLSLFGFDLLIDPGTYL